MQDTFEECGVDISEYSWPSAQTIGEWCAGSEAAVLIQFGMELTSTARRWVYCGISADGAAIDRHVEGFMVKTDTYRIALPAWEQGNKAGDTTVTNTVLGIGRACMFY